MPLTINDDVDEAPSKPEEANKPKETEMSVNTETSEPKKTRAAVAAKLSKGKKPAKASKKAKAAPKAKKNGEARATTREPKSEFALKYGPRESGLRGKAIEVLAGTLGKPVELADIAKAICGNKSDESLKQANGALVLCNKLYYGGDAPSPRPFTLIRTKDEDGTVSWTLKKA